MVTKMKISIVLAVMALVMLSVSSSFAANCDGMSIQSVAAIDGGNGAQVWLVNNNAAACGNVGAGQAFLFNLPSVNTDKMLATLLTAFSLGKNVWVAYDDSNSPGLLQVVAVQAQ